MEFSAASVLVFILFVWVRKVKDMARLGWELISGVDAPTIQKWYFKISKILNNDGVKIEKGTQSQSYSGRLNAIINSTQVANPDRH